MKPITMPYSNLENAFRACSRFLAALACWCLLPQSAAADIVTGASGVWNDPATWTGNIVPTASDTAIVDGDFTVSVSEGVAASAAIVMIGGDSAGTLSINGGAVKSTTSYIGGGIAGAGTAIVTSGTWDNSGELSVIGGMSNGTLVINGGLVKNTNGYIDGTFFGGMGSSTTATVASGTWANSGRLTVSGGTLNLCDSGVVNIANGTGTLFLASESGNGILNLGTGGTAGTLEAAIVTGLTGTSTVNFNHTGSYTFGSQLTGNLMVNKLGSGTTTLKAANTHTGGTILSEGQLNINNANAVGTGTLTINGGSLDNTSGTAVTLANAIAQKWNGNFTFVGSNTLNLGSGTATLGANVTVTVNSGTLAVGGMGGDGTNGYCLTKAGDGTLSTSILTIGDGCTGVLNITGGTVTDSTGYIGYMSNMGGMNETYPNGTVNVTSGTWVNSNELYVGFMGNGTLKINGGLVRNTTGYIGWDMGSNGTAIVTSGTWANSGALYVGGMSNGTLIINGGLVKNTNAYLGDNATVTVSSGTWANSGELSVIGGTMNLCDSGVVNTGTLALASEFWNGTLNLGTGGTAGTLEAAAVTGGSGIATVNFNHTGAYTFAPTLSGNLTVNKLASGTTTLTGTNTYTGATNIAAGKLIVAASISASSLTTVSGSGTLAGSGTVGALTVASGGTVNPGDSVGTLKVNGKTTFQNGGTLALDLTKDATGTAGVAYDQLAITSNLNLTGISVGGFKLSLQSIAGDSSAFNPGSNYTWTSVVTTTGGISGFAANQFSIDLAGFYAGTVTGSFSVIQNGNNLDLEYLAVPEPQTWAMLAGGAGILLVFRKKVAQAGLKAA